MIFNKLAQAPQSFIPPSSTYNTHQAQLGAQTMLGPSRLVTRDLGTQMAIVLAHDEPITFLAQVSFLGLIIIFESIDELSLGVLPMGQSILRCPFPRQV
jgi:hypothetical protein